MTELRKGQRVWVEAEIINPREDSSGYVDARLVHDIGNDGTDIIELCASEARVDVPHQDHPAYLARREAMVRAMVDRGAAWDISAGDVTHEFLIDAADKLLRAIDETPVPEWAGGEHE